MTARSITGYTRPTRTRLLCTARTSTCTAFTIDGFFPILKRGIIGTYYQVSRKYLPLYVEEFQFRYNNRNNERIFETAIAGC